MRLKILYAVAWLLRVRVAMILIVPRKVKAVEVNASWVEVPL